MKRADVSSYKWSIDHPFWIGSAIAPSMMPKSYSRSQISSLEYASRGVVTLAPKLPPYNSSVIEGETGWLYHTPDNIPSILDTLAKNPASLTCTRVQAYQHVRSERLLSHQHNEHRLGFYRQICPSPKAKPKAKRLRDDNEKRANNHEDRPTPNDLPNLISAH